MPLPTSGPISHSQIMAEFSQTGQFDLSANGAPLINKTPSTLIAETDFYGASAVPPGYFPESIGNRGGIGGWGQNKAGAGVSNESYTANSAGCQAVCFGQSGRNETVYYYWIVTDGDHDGWTPPNAGKTVKVDYKLNCSSSNDDASHVAVTLLMSCKHKKYTSGIGQFQTIQSSNAPTGSSEGIEAISVAYCDKVAAWDRVGNVKRELGNKTSMSLDNTVEFEWKNAGFNKGLGWMMATSFSTKYAGSGQAVGNLSSSRISLYDI